MSGQRGRCVSRRWVCRGWRCRRCCGAFSSPGGGRANVLSQLAEQTVRIGIVWAALGGPTPRMGCRGALHGSAGRNGGSEAVSTGLMAFLLPGGPPLLRLTACTASP
ncbi:MAG: hypothetical protein ACLUIR_01745 [Faecalibacterium prausnitzii]